MPHAQLNYTLGILLCAPGRIHCGRDVFVSVGGRHKARLKGSRCEINTFLQHQMEKLIKPRNVSTNDLRVLGDLLVLGEKEAEHAPEAGKTCIAIGRLVNGLGWPAKSSSLCAKSACM